MTDSLQPVAGSLSARVIRACPEHAQCPLDCPKRPVVELGEVANFDHQRSVMARLKENYFQWRQTQS